MLSSMVDPSDLLAAERTLLAWIRTGIALMGLGFLVARSGLLLADVELLGGYAAHSADSGPVGLVVLFAGVCLNVWASLRHHFMVARMRAGVEPVGSTGPVVIGVTTGIGGALLIALLAGVLR